jgi:hypothetical protein
MRNFVGHKVLLILRNPAGTCRNIYGREQRYPPINETLIASFNEAKNTSFMGQSPSSEGDTRSSNFPPFTETEDLLECLQEAINWPR